MVSEVSVDPGECGGVSDRDGCGVSRYHSLYYLGG